MTDRKIVVRSIVKADDQIIFELIQSILSAHKLDVPGTAYFDPQLAVLSEFYGQFTETKAAYFVLEIDGQVVGGAGFGPIDLENQICELQKLYLADECQGQGYSRLLLEKVFSEAKVFYKKIYLETHSNLEKAMKIYPKFGFERLESPLNGSEHGFMNHWMIKEL